MLLSRAVQDGLISGLGVPSEDFFQNYDFIGANLTGVRAGFQRFSRALDDVERLQILREILKSVESLKLVEEARRTGEDKDRLRQAREAAYRFMSVIAGNKPHYEDAIRALFAGDPARFEELIAGWPADVRDHASQLAERAFRGEVPARAG